eukprot:1161820-Pelagomonas_calceolata.AAC.7
MSRLHHALHSPSLPLARQSGRQLRHERPPSSTATVVTAVTLVAVVVVAVVVVAIVAIVAIVAVVVAFVVVMLSFLFPVALAAPVAVAIFATALCPARGVCGRPQDAQQLAVQLRRLPVARFAAVAILVGAVPKAAMA